MKRLIVGGLLAGVGALTLTMAVGDVQASPESLLPPGFDDPAPTPSPAPRPSSAPRPAGSAQPPAPASTPVVQPLPGDTASGAPPSATLPGDLPSLEELERLSPDELDELLGLKPKVDIPPGARRSMERVGLLSVDEGGMPAGSLAQQPVALVRAALGAIRTPMVSRWGHILVRRALASRLEAPDGMPPAEFAGLRARALNAMGEFEAARGIAQDIDTGNWNRTLADAAIDSYVATGDLTGACPLVLFRGELRRDARWDMLQAICNAYAGESARARTDLIRLRSRGQAPAIDVLLAQRYAGAAGRGRSAVNLEWDGVDELNPWRYGLALALGADIPEALTEDLAPYYQRVSARSPALPVAARIEGAERAAEEGIFSAAALIDLYSQYYADNGAEGEYGPLSVQLREAYVAAEPADRLTAIRAVWADDAPDYARIVLTAYAAARIPATEELAPDAGRLIASMLAAGLDRDAAEWADALAAGSEGWALLAVAAPGTAQVSSGAVDSFIDDDDSVGQRRSAFLVAGLAGLGRIDEDTTGSLSRRLDVDLGRQTKWSRLIDRAGQLRNQPLVALLAGVGMQGTGWELMTPRHLFHIVRALNNAGLGAEARMIAAEAIARA